MSALAAWARSAKETDELCLLSKQAALSVLLALVSRVGAGGLGVLLAQAYVPELAAALGLAAPLPQLLEQQQQQGRERQLPRLDPRVAALLPAVGEAGAMWGDGEAGPAGSGAAVVGAGGAVGAPARLRTALRGLRPVVAALTALTSLVLHTLAEEVAALEAHGQRGDGDVDAGGGESRDASLGSGARRRDLGAGSEGPARPSSTSPLSASARSTVAQRASVVEQALSLLEALLTADPLRGPLLRALAGPRIAVLDQAVRLRGGAGRAPVALRWVLLSKPLMRRSFNAIASILGLEGVQVRLASPRSLRFIVPFGCARALL